MDSVVLSPVRLPNKIRGSDKNGILTWIAWGNALLYYMCKMLVSAKLSDTLLGITVAFHLDLLTNAKNVFSFSFPLPLFHYSLNLRSACILLCSFLKTNTDHFCTSRFCAPIQSLTYCNTHQPLMLPLQPLAHPVHYAPIVHFPSRKWRWTKTSRLATKRTHPTTMPTSMPKQEIEANTAPVMWPLGAE